MGKIREFCENRNEDTIIDEDGRKYQMEQAMDGSEKDTQEGILQQYIDNEAMINEALRISLATASPDKSIEVLLEYLGKTLKCERAYIFEGTVGEEYSNTYEWCADGVVPQKENLQNLEYDVVRIWIERFQTNNNVIIKNLEDIKEADPAMYECLYPQDIHSLVTSPIVSNNEIVGFYGVDNPPADMLEHISTLFQIMGHFIMVLMRWCELFKKLESISYYDQLTGFGNRHAMDAYVEAMKPENSVGVLYCDVMGLKKVNDSKGHQAGDELLLRACRCLQHVFSEYSLFRIGGDEFLVLCAGITQERLQEKVELLKQDMEEQNALMALGSIWCPDSKEDIDQLLLRADASMYEDKRKYYNKGGIQDRRSR